MKKLLLFIVILCVSGLQAFAGHVDTYGIGSKATAMGGAVVAGSDDPFAVYYNPAAMTNIKQKTLSIGSHFVQPALEIKSYDVKLPASVGGGELRDSGEKDTSDLLIIPHFGYVQPLNDKITLGIAFYVPYGLDLKWDDNTSNNPEAYNSYHSWYIRKVLTPSVAYKVNDKLSFGAGLAIGQSEAGNTRKIFIPAAYKSSATWQAYIASHNPSLDSATVTAMANAYAAQYTALSDAKVKVDLDQNTNVSANLGALYHFNDKASFGVTYRSYAHVNMDGKAKVTNDAGTLNESVDAHTSIDTPDSLQFGLEYKFTPKFKVEADMVRTYWSRIKSYTINFDDTFLTMDEEYAPRNWKDTWQYKIGTEYKLNDTVALRAGYYYDPSVVPNNTFDVMWPDSNKHIFSAGAGFDFGKISVDTVVQYIKVEELKIALGDSPSLNDSYTDGSEVAAVAGGHIMSAGVTVNYKF